MTDVARDLETVLQLVDPDGESHAATIRVLQDRRPVTLTIESDGLPSPMAFEGGDVEDCLVALRSELDERDVRLLCNRFRRDALVSGMSCSMSDGRSCYVVEMGRPVSPERDLVDALGPAPVVQVASADEAAAHIEAYVRSCRSRSAMALARMRTFITRRR